MRISDWSSDVCSSDLAIHDRGRHAKTDALHRKRHVQPEIEGIYTLRFLIRIQPEKTGSIILRRNSKHGAARKTMLRQRIFPTIEPLAIAPQPSDVRKTTRSQPRPDGRTQCRERGDREGADSSEDGTLN